MERIFSSPSRNFKRCFIGVEPIKDEQVDSALCHYEIETQSQCSSLLFLSRSGRLCSVDIELQYTLVTLCTKLDILGNSISNHSSK